MKCPCQTRQVVVLLLCCLWMSAFSRMAKSEIPLPVMRQAANVVRVSLPDSTGGALGSGVYLGDRLVLSCWHITMRSRGVGSVTFRNGEVHVGRVVKADSDYDCMLFELDTKPSALGSRLADRQGAIGESVTIGGWGCGQLGFMAGEIKSRAMPNKDGMPPDWINVLPRGNGVMRDGDSGGPMFNDDGHVIGAAWGADSVVSVGTNAGRTQLFLREYRTRIDKWEAEFQLTATYRDRYGGGRGIFAPAPSSRNGWRASAQATTCNPLPSSRDIWVVSPGATCDPETMTCDPGTGGSVVETLPPPPLPPPLPGRAATIAIGTVVAGDVASVTNSGTEADAVLDFVIPSGLDGPAGPPGDTATVTKEDCEQVAELLATDANFVAMVVAAMKADGGFKGEAGKDGRTPDIKEIVDQLPEVVLEIYDWGTGEVFSQSRPLGEPLRIMLEPLDPQRSRPVAR